TSSDKTIDALYAFTDCEVPISPNCCVIKDEKPHFLGVSDVLRHSVDNTRSILKRELEIEHGEVSETLLLASLERIFIEERIYKDKEYEESKTREEAVAHIDKRLEPYKPQFIREITEEDIVRLFEIKMGRILRFNRAKNEELVAKCLERLKEIAYHLEHLTEYTIEWYRRLKEKYGANYPRQTVIRSFDTIEAAKVAEANERLYINREEGFIGTSLKKDEFLFNCSSIDEIIIFYKDGRYKVVKVQEKMSVGKNILHVAIFKRGDTRTIYNVIYQNGRGGTYYMKRFAVTGVNRDREYNITPGLPGTRVCWFTANPNGEAEVVRVTLKPKARLKTLQIDVDFKDIKPKGKGTIGNIVTKNEVHRFSLKEKGMSTLGGRQVWFDPDVLRLNYDGRGDYLGEFMGDDKVLVILNNGEYYTSTFDVSNHYEDNILRIEKYNPKTIRTAILNDADQGGKPYLKRFPLEPSAKPVSFIGDNKGSQLILLTDELGARFRITFGGADSGREPLEVTAMDFVSVKSCKAKGKRLSDREIESIDEIEPVDIPQTDVYEEAEDIETQEVEDTDIEHEKSDDEIRDEITGQQRLFD
ncbi:MAG: DNA gyrase/topoisomerase IV subunit A, partial [Muribaculaceae bacterium]|nr:DNA gyrase/topoisomerase IV subunit A [Muribaculaceae bacterium]